MGTARERTEPPALTATGGEVGHRVAPRAERVARPRRAARGTLPAMAQARRSEPLRAEPADPVAMAPAPPSRRRSIALGLAVGFAIAVAGIAIAFSIIAIPLFIVASTEPTSGLDRSLVRTGLFKVALPVGVVSGVAAGVAVGVWYARGGRLPTDRTPLEL